jgi:hypothetical protein
MAGLTSLGWVVQVRGLDATFPAPTATALADAQHALAAIADDTRVLVDGLALGAMPQIAAAHRQRLRSTISRR